MPSKKTLSFLIKIGIVFLSFFFIYNKLELVSNDTLGDINYNSILFKLKNNSSIIICVFFLMIINWLVEAFKWRFMILKIEKISILISLRAVFSGITVSSFTPNRIGEYAGRVFCLEKGDRIQAVLITVLGSMAQLLTTILFGSLAFYVLYESLITKTEIFRNLEISSLSFILLFIINLSFLLIFFNISTLVNFLMKYKVFYFLENYINIISMFSYRDLFKVLLLSILRYLIFSSQFLILLNLFGVDIGLYEAVFSVMLVFFFITITPTIALAEIGVRGSVALLVFGLFSNNVVGILSSIFILWIINLIIPAIIGSFFIFSLKFFRKS